ncbi:hypothetical protein GZ78_27330 [Endozoicomonas numazuensis]|uniref:Uncharacterized protein n=1 Tax=Endozoicomonas numazuensis TaxID=1137799 RepID=A0A081N142_9GAMM|nr:hypothetical protein GZ78_27330 [Endozoicomonas numazuensis]
MTVAQGMSRYKWLTRQGVLWKMRCIQTRRLFVVGPVGPLAMVNCELRQARKGATVAVTPCAGVWLAGFASICIKFLDVV